MGKPLKPLALMVIGPLALAGAMAVLIPLLDLPLPLDAWRMKLQAGAGVGLLVGVPLFFGIAWAGSRRSPVGMVNELRRKWRSLQRVLGVSLVFSLGYFLSCLMHEVKDGSLVFSFGWLLIGGFGSCLIALRLEQLDKLPSVGANDPGHS